MTGNNDINNIRVSLGETGYSTIKPRRCPTIDRWDETGEGILGGQDASRNRIVRSFRNGCYQHLMFVGICGFVICNHCDKEILLLDPWPTFHSRWTGLIPTVDPRPLTNQNTEAKERIANLATFLRNAVAMGYTLSGILLSHMHFDHADDIPLLLELLAADTENYTDHNGRQFLLSGPAVDVEALPQICCDYDTLIYYLAYYFYVPYRNITIHGDAERRRGPTCYWYGNTELRDRLDQQERSGYALRSTEAWDAVKNRYLFIRQQERIVPFIPQPEGIVRDNPCWREINVNGQRLHYDDSFNILLDEDERCQAGRQCEPFKLGNFSITPYVWDHMNTGAFKLYQRAIDEQSAGDLQRTTAYMIQHSSSQNAKRTFVIGSAGEMNEQWTDAIVETLPDIETDLLVQSIVDSHPGPFMHFRFQTNAMQECMTNHIKVNDALIFAHFEEFVREVADRGQFLEGFDEAVSYNLRVLRSKIQDRREEGNTQQADCYDQLIQNNRLYVLGRRGPGFEVPYPNDPLEFEEEENEFI